MTAELAALANTAISLAYFAVAYAILMPLVQGGQFPGNRLGTATGAIFLSCAFGHGLHAYHALSMLAQDDSAGGGMGISWYVAATDVGTAAIAIYYWTLRRTYGALMQGASLFADLEQQRRMIELEHRVALTSARATAERERDAQALMLRAVIANSQSMVHVKDLDGRYLMANKVFERAFSVQESALLGQTDEFLDPEMAPIWRANDLRARLGEYATEEQSEGPDGRCYYESVKFPLHDPDGEVYATCGISLDVTARRLANAEMARARDVALAATAAKSAFLATMSHEIRTPMNAVIGLTGLLLGTQLDEQQRDLMETVRTSGDVLLVVINDILDFSKIEAGELHLENQDFSLRGCAEGSLDLVAQVAAAKGLDLVLDVAEECPRRVVGDPSRLRQVLVNLLNNAVKFTEAGDVLLTITGTTEDDRAVLRFSVRDTGIGIPADRMDRLFHSFSQVDASTTRVYGGTGLGLAISRGLVRAMGGELQVQSVYGEGSTFTFTVTLGISDQPEPPEPLTPVTMIGRSVLVVDDNETNRRVLELQLSVWGLRATCVAGSEEALELVAAGAVYDLAILDLHMPVMDGDQLAVALRALPGGQSLPMVMLRSLGPLPSPRPGSPFAAVLTKPVKLAALQAALCGALSGDQAVEQTQPSGAPLTAEIRSRLHILLAEDNAVNQKVAKLMLAQLGYEVDAVANGAEAVAAVAAVAYDVVLMDIHMPRMDGLQATRAIRSTMPTARQPRIVALTASALVEDRQACAEAGMDDFLVKPFRQEQLAAILDQQTWSRPPLAHSVPVGSFDPAAIDALVTEVGGDASLRTELLTSYVREGDVRMAELFTGAQAGDRAAVQAAAHGMRSSSQLIGLNRLARLLERLEASAGSDGGDLAPAAGVAGGEYRSATATIAAFLSTNASTESATETAAGAVPLSTAT